MGDQFSTKGTEMLLEALSRNRSVFMTVRSDSMAPLLRRGDQIRIGPVAADGLVIGDIIVVGQIGDLVAHRFWGVQDIDNRAYLLTRGDRLNHYDPFTTQDELRAVVTGRRRFGRLLELDNGAGAWLNRRLTRLARLEAQVRQIPFPDGRSGNGRLDNHEFSGRVVGRLLYLSASILTALANRLVGS